MDRNRVLVYGATGYTGKLIARRAKATGVSPILAGRDAAKTRAVAEPLGFEHRSAALDDRASLDAMMQGVAVVLHAAGPFSHTSKPMVDACLRNRCHYLDITGEIAVFEALAARDRDAQALGVTLLPGAGFDVVPSDCLAAYVARKLPDATKLTLALAGLDNPSRGTAKTAIEGLGLGTPVRRDGRFVTLRFPKRRSFDFGGGPRRCIAVGWGDVSTAWHSTRIPDIEVYFEATRMLSAMSALSTYAGWLLRRKAVQSWLTRQIGKQPEGPSDSQREADRALIVAIAENAAGQRAAARLETPEGYTLTAQTALEAAMRLARGEGKPGFFTPSKLFGADFILGFAGVKRVDL